MKLRIYAIIVTLVLLAVLTNPSAEQHYAKLAQLYPWVNESLLADAQEKVWLLSSTSDQISEPAYDTTLGRGQNVQLIYTSLGALSFVQYDERLVHCGNDEGPSKPISLGFLGYVFAKRPASEPHEGETAAKQGQAKPFTASLGAQRIVNLKPVEASTNSFGIKGPMMIDMPPRPKDALYKMQSLE